MGKRETNMTLKLHQASVMSTLLTKLLQHSLMYTALVSITSRIFLAWNYYQPKGLIPICQDQSPKFKIMELKSVIMKS